MNKKIIIPICLLFITMIGIGCVSATDNNSSYIDDTPSHMPDKQQINAHTDVNYPTPEANDKRTDINDKVLPGT
jgi:hypothetical protein